MPRKRTKSILAGVSIRGTLHFSIGAFRDSGKIALSAIRATIGQDVRLCDKFEAEGEVCLAGAFITGHLVCDKRTFHNGTSSFNHLGTVVLNAEAIKIGGAALLRDC